MLQAGLGAVWLLRTGEGRKGVVFYWSPEELRWAWCMHAHFEPVLRCVCESR